LLGVSDQVIVGRTVPSPVPGVQVQIPTWSPKLPLKWPDQLREAIKPVKLPSRPTNIGPAGSRQRPGDELSTTRAGHRRTSRPKPGSSSGQSRTRSSGLEHCTISVVRNSSNWPEPSRTTSASSYVRRIACGRWQPGPRLPWCRRGHSSARGRPPCSAMRRDSKARSGRGRRS